MQRGAKKLFCQLDQVKDILDIGTEVRSSLLKEYPEKTELEGCSKIASSVIFGLLILKDYDVFLHSGNINLDGNHHEHNWVEVYLDGEEFILDVTLTQFVKKLGREIPDIIFAPKEEVVALYGYGQSQEYDWRRDQCSEAIWQQVLEKLGIPKPVQEVLEEIADYVSY